jgi:hypothetical protein
MGPKALVDAKVEKTKIPMGQHVLRAVRLCNHRAASHRFEGLYDTAGNWNKTL